MTKLITLCRIIVGLINVLPVRGVLAAQRMESAYAISLQSSELQILMRHRALLFGILGGFILFSAFRPDYQWAAMIMAAISMIGFAVLTLTNAPYNAELGRVLTADIVGIVFLAIAVVLKLLLNAENP